MCSNAPPGGKADLLLISTFFQRVVRYRGWEKGEEEEQMGSEEVKLGCSFLWRRKRRSRAHH